MSEQSAAPPPQTPIKVALTINGRPVEAPKGQLVIDAAERGGTFIPRFCYHPRMRPVGMCRMCVVDIDTGRGPALQPACMIPVADGMVVDTESPVTKKAQDGVLEFLLINHPLDCPVCDKGGECPLQDNAYAYGPGESRFVEEKRHFEKPIPLSPLVLLDRERCILCDRCTRFAKEVAGDPLIHFLERGSYTEVNTFPDDPFASYFSGNTIQICPVGALTATSYRFKARPWDLEKAESTCTTCSVGCRVSIDASRNEILRYQGVDIDPVNWGWLCDKGRFDFEAIHSDERLSEPLIRKADELIPTTWAEALGGTAEALSKASPEGIGFVGGSRFTNEAAYAWAKLAKGVLGTDNVDCQLGDGLPAEVAIGLPRATIDDACTRGTVLVIAGDVKEELPVLFLRLRDAVVNRGVRVVEVGPVAGGLTEYAAASLRCRPGDVAGAVSALVAGGDASAVVEGDLDAAKAMIAADPTLTVILGRPSVGESPASVVEATSVLRNMCPDARFLVALRRGNVHGAIDMGLAPGLLPGHVALDDGRDWFGAEWPTLPSERGLDTIGILSAAAEGRLDVLVLLGADPLADFVDRDLVSRALTGARTVVAVDTFLTGSSRQADVVLPAAGYAEVSGTTTNLEGRVSLVQQKVTPPGTARADWMLAAELAFRLGADLGLESVEQIWDEVERLAPSHQGITLDLLRSPLGVDGVLAPMPEELAHAAEGTPVWIHSHHPLHATTAHAASAIADAGSADEHTEAVAVAKQAAADAVEESAAQAEADAAAPDAGHAAAARPVLLEFKRSAPFQPPPVDAYGLRLVVTRRLYDNGTGVQQSPSLAGLAPGSTLRLSATDLDRLGVTSGGQVKVTSGRGSLTCAVEADGGVPAGAAALVVNQPGTDPAELVDASTAVTVIQVENVR